jgi:hypothetical protein
VKGAVPGKAYRVFSDEELQELTEGVQWLSAAEPAFEFWNNDDDAIYDRLKARRCRTCFIPIHRSDVRQAASRSGGFTGHLQRA